MAKRYWANEIGTDRKSTSIVGIITESDATLRFLFFACHNAM